MTSTELVACTIATQSHLALAHCVAKSFATHHPDGLVHILLVDSDRLPSCFEGMPVVGVPLADLDVPEVERMMARYSAFELCNALKPTLLSHVLVQLGHERAFYLDSDLFVVRELSDVARCLDDADVVLTPHLCMPPPPTSVFTDRDLAILRGGSLNGGFVAVRRSENSERVLQWWAARNSTGSYHRRDQGMNCDQRWLDMLPGFAGVRVLSEPGLNVAFWNLDERTITSSDAGYLCNGEPLRFFHFSGFDPDDHRALTKHFSTVTLPSRPDLRPIVEHYRAELKRSREACERSRTVRPGLGEASRPAARAVDAMLETRVVGAERSPARSDRFVECMRRAAVALGDGDHDLACDELARSAIWSDALPMALPGVWLDLLGDRVAPDCLAALQVSIAWDRLRRRPALDLLVAGAHDVLAVPATTAVEHDPPALWRAAAPIPDGTEPKLDIEAARAASFGRHRGGLACGIAALSPLHREGGVVLDPFVEHTLLSRDAVPHDRPWIGLVHNPPTRPAWYSIDQSATLLLTDPRFESSLPWCRGLFAFSRTLAEWWSARVPVEVEVVPHPTVAPSRYFSMTDFLANPSPRVVQIGTWLRKLHAIDDLRVRTLRRCLVHQHEPYIEQLFADERRALARPARPMDVEVLPFLDDAQYDELLAANIVFVELYGASANNTVVECLARATPLVINPLPAVREYLGDDYPLYAATRIEAARRADDPDLVAAAHRHLASRVAAERLVPDAFAGAVARSSIYRGLDPA